jgi:hypothetical protein
VSSIFIHFNLEKGMKTKNLLVYSISGRRPHYSSTQHQLFHQCITLVLLFCFLIVSFVPLRAFADNGPSTLVIAPLADMVEEATSPAGAVVSFTLPVATEYDTNTNTSATVPVSCDKTSGDTFSLGTTTVSCTSQGVTDTSLTAGATFAIVVRDTTAPSMVLHGSSTLSLALHDVYTEEGASSTDSVDGDLSSSVQISGAVDTATVGVYALVYSNSDNAQNSASTTRVVTVIDNATSSATTTSDTVPPLGPTLITSSTHTEGATTTTKDVDLSWNSGSDETALLGYSYLFDHEATTTPDGISEGLANGTTTTLAPGTWYFHIMSLDVAGNNSTPIHFGPIIIESDGSSSGPDTTAPTGLTLVTSPSHALSTTTSTSTVTMNWDTATDTSLVSYSYIFDHEASTTPDVLPEVNDTTVTTSLTNGTWYFHVRATDSAGNGGDTVHYGPFTILVPDTTLPSIPTLSVTKSATSTLLLSWISTDDTAVAGYAYSVSTSSTALPGSSVDTSATSTTVTLSDGDYYVAVASFDTSGNESAIATSGPFTIDSLAPQITLLGQSDMNVVVGTHYNEPGYSAYDSHDGDVTSLVQVTGTVNSSVLGDYTRSYTVQDASHNSVVAERVIHVISDTVSPTSPGATLIKSGTTTATLSWTSSSDNVGVTSYLYDIATSTTLIPHTQVASTTLEASSTLSDGVWYGYVRSEDASGNVSSITKTNSIIIDTTAPVITLSGSSTVFVYQNDVYLDAGASAEDAQDGGVSAFIIATSTVDTSVLGTYAVTYTVSDAHGNTAVPVTRVVQVILPPDTTAPSVPVLHVNKTASTSLEIVWSPATDDRAVDHYLYSLSQDASSTPLTSVSSSTTQISSSTLADGLWYATLRAVDTSGNESAIATATPVRIDTVAPSVTLVGSSTVQVFQGRAYIEVGAVASDETDGDVTNTVVTTGTVDTSVLGDTTITYNAHDTAGNVSHVNRLVQVIPLVYYNVSTSVVSGKGQISTPATTSIEINHDYEVDLIPNHGYVVTSVVLDGTSLATSTHIALLNVVAPHTLQISFAPLAQRNTYTISSAVVSRGAVVAPSNILEGEDGVVTFVPAYLYDVASLQVNGAPVATTTSYAITNASTSLHFDVQFSPTIYDVTAPSDIASLQVTIPEKTISNTHILSFSWATSTDNLAGVEGYSYVLDTASSTVPDSTVISTASTSASFSESYGTYYFHVRAVDYLGNASQVTHMGPFLLSDSHVYVENSTLRGVMKDFVSPTISEAQALSLFGNVSLIDSSLQGAYTVTNSNATSTQIATSSIQNTSLSQSVVTNSQLQNSTLENSDITGVTGNHLQATSSSLQNVNAHTASFEEVIASSTSATAVKLTRGVVGSSTLHDLIGHDIAIYNNTVASGTFLLPNGAEYTVTNSVPVEYIEDDAPIAGVRPFIHDYTVAFVSTSTDPDLSFSAFGDTWSETIDYGDGSSSVATTSRLDTQFLHTYNVPGDYLITYTLTDIAGKTSTLQKIFTLPDPYANILVRGGGPKTEQEVFENAKGFGGSSSGGSSIQMTPQFDKKENDASSTPLLQDIPNLSKLPVIVLKSNDEKSTVKPLLSTIKHNTAKATTTGVRMTVKKNSAHLRAKTGFVSDLPTEEVIATSTIKTTKTNKTFFNQFFSFFGNFGR